MGAGRGKTIGKETSENAKKCYADTILEALMGLVSPAGDTRQRVDFKSRPMEFPYGPLKASSSIRVCTPLMVSGPRACATGCATRKGDSAHEARPSRKLGS